MYLRQIREILDPIDTDSLLAADVICSFIGPMFGNQAGIVLTKVPHGACKAAPGLTARQTNRQRKIER